MCTWIFPIRQECRMYHIRRFWFFCSPAKRRRCTYDYIAQTRPFLFVKRRKKKYNVWYVVTVFVSSQILKSLNVCILTIGIWKTTCCGQTWKRSKNKKVNGYSIVVTVTSQPVACDYICLTPKGTFNVTYIYEVVYLTRLNGLWVLLLQHCF